MLSMSYDDYIREFDIQLSQLDPVKVMQDLGDKSILLCWESPGVFCHRRCVAQWLESSLGIVIPELGFCCDNYPTYPYMALKGSSEAKNCLKLLTKIYLINEGTQRPPISPEDDGQPSSLTSNLADS